MIEGRMDFSRRESDERGTSDITFSEGEIREGDIGQELAEELAEEFSRISNNRGVY